MSPKRRRIKARAAGVALLACAGLLTASEGNSRSTEAAVRKSGTFRVGMNDFDFVDPAKAFLTESWSVLRLSCSTLMAHPNRSLPHGLRVVPQAAEDYPRVSRDGRKYTFTIRKGLRFSNGQPVRAANFAYALNRLLNPQTRSTSIEFFHYEDIVGAQAVIDGRALEATGITAKGRTLVIKLTRPRGDFAARLAIPFFCPVPVGLPIDPEGLGAEIPSTGPYRIMRYVPGREVVLERNPFYRGRRPGNVDRFVFEIDRGGLERLVRKVERGELDAVEVFGGPLPLQAGLRAELRQKYGVNRGRFYVWPAPNLLYIALNTERPLFRNNLRLRQAINFAVDRSAMVREHGPVIGYATDQILPGGMPGYRNAHIYPLRGPNLAKARALARGSLRGGKAIMYTAPVGSPLGVAQVVQANLRAIGLEVEIKTFPGGVRFRRLGTRGEPFDMALAIWFPDWIDPYQFFNVLFDGRTIKDTDNTNWSYVNSPRHNRLMERASRLFGRARYRAYGRLDVDFMRTVAPVVPYMNFNATWLVSERVGCKVFKPHLDLNAVCLK